MRSFRFPSTIAALATVGLSIAGCGKDAREAPPASAVVVRDTVRTHIDTVESGGEVVSAAAATPAPVEGIWITDANALSLFGMMNSRAIAAANRQLERYRSDTLRVFAETMVREHSAMQHSADSVAAVTRIAPVPSALAEPLGAMLQAQVDSSGDVRAAALDRAYVRQQIASHDLMAKYVEQFSAVSQRPEVQGLMSAAAGRMRSQVERARALQAMLATADSLAAADSAAKAAARAKRQTPRR